MTTNLVDRYVLTALRRVPEGQRADIDRELRASIADAVDARVESGEPPGEAERNTLLELGDPDKLADSYAGRRSYLIGPDVFGVWRRFMVMLFTVVLPVVVTISVVADVLDDAGIGVIIGGAVTAIITVSVHLAFWTTLVFAVIERTGVGQAELGVPFDPDNLPHYEQGRRASTQMIVDLVWIVLLGAALVLQQFTFTDVPVLDPANWSFWWPYLLVILALEGAYAVWVHRMRVRTHLTTAVNAVLGLATAIPMIWLLATDRFFNPEFSFGDASVVGWASNVTIVVILAVTVWDIVDQGLRAERSRKGLGTRVPGTGLPG